MSHLYNFREGWRSESLANYILSKISFIAQPTNVSNDIGTDFYCTLFKITKEDDTNYLDPITTICVQIKSDTSNIDITEKREYLSELILPYFVGVVDKDKLTLTVYSGEILPIYFSCPNTDCKTLTIKLSEKRPPIPTDFIVRKDSTHTLLFPKISVFNIDDEYLKNPGLIKDLLKIAKEIQENISSKNLTEYSFLVQDGVYIFANNKSLHVFRANFLKRLSEYFYNLVAIKNAIQDGQIKDDDKYINERQLFIDFYEKLNKLYKEDFTEGKDFPRWLKSPYDKLNE